MSESPQPAPKPERWWYQYHLWHLLVLVTVAAIPCSWYACKIRWFSPPMILPPRIDPFAAGAAAMKQYDTNGDGTISGDELEKAPSLKKSLARIDRNEDAAVTAAETTGRIRQWQDSKLGRCSLLCEVNKGGKPLVGATVKFVPEKFLGDQMQTATGVTDEDGLADVSVPISSDEPSGLAPGLYLVEITKKGEDIPAKYNTKTILGEEIAIDVDELGILRFDLD